MPFRVSGKNLDIGEALRERVNGRVAEVLGKYFDGGYSGHVTVAREAFGFRTECVVHLDSGITLNADSVAADPYASADQAADRIEQRLRRYHRKLKDYHIAQRHNENGKQAAALDTQNYVLTAPEADNDDEVTEFNPTIIAETKTSLDRLSVSEAVVKLDMTGAPVVVFRHAGSGRINVVYRRGDGNIGWIDPPGAAADSH